MTYMPTEERREAEGNDPVPAYGRRLLAAGVLSEMELGDIEAATMASVEEVVKQVLDAPGPSPEAVTSDLYKSAENVPA